MMFLEGYMGAPPTMVVVSACAGTAIRPADRNAAVEAAARNVRIFDIRSLPSNGLPRRPPGCLDLRRGFRKGFKRFPWDMDFQSDASVLADLLGRTASGDRAAFSELYDLTNAKLFGVIRRILVRPDLAKEALQESYVRVWSNAYRYDAGHASAMTWMIAIARNQAIDLKRKANERVAAQAVAL